MNELKDKFAFIDNTWCFVPKTVTQWVLDPMGNYPEARPNDLLNSLGFIPTFLVPTADNVIEKALELYGFNLGGPMTGCTITTSGIMQYPGDPDQYPLATCQCGDQTVYVYSYGIISFVNTETKESVTYRFD